MNSAELDRWNQAQALLDGFLEDPAANTVETVRARASGCGCADEFSALLGAMDIDSALDAPLEELIREMSADQLRQGALSGRIIGRWILGEEIGRGGMSAVYHAQRTGDGFEQHAALKILSLTFASQALVDSFLRERQILSGLQHPGIARLIDGGLTAEGSPFLVMDYVNGQRIDAWCREHKPDTRLLVGMLKQLADAVAYAQQNLIIHRDINASNVLVNEHGRPVLIDFGIAGLLGTDHGQTLHAFTAKFAAPEQVAGGRSTTATDVYALGRLLESLLPEGTADPELRCLIEVATAADPDRRYANARSLADDLQAWLEQRPMRARPPSVRYRAGRFMVRHRWAVAGGALIVLSLLGGIAGSLWQARIAANERDLARAESIRATQVTGFLKELFRASDPDQSRGEAITARQLLDQGAYQIHNTLDITPELKTEMLILLGDLYRELDELPSAESLLADALSIAESIQDVPLVVEALRATAHQKMSSQAHAEALALTLRAQQLLQDTGAVPGIQHSTLMQPMLFSLAELGRVDEAVKNGQTALANAREVQGLPHSALFNYLYSLANVTVIAERETEAEPLLLEAMQLDPEAADSPTIQIALLSSLASITDEKGEIESALDYSRRAVELTDRIYPPDHSERARQLSSHATLLVKFGRLQEAEQAMQEALDIYVAIYDESAHPRVAAAYNNLGRVMVMQGKYADATVFIALARDMAGDLFGRNDPRFAIATGNLGDVQRRAGNLNEADELLQQNLELRRTILGPEHRSVGNALGLLAVLRLDQQQYDEALAFIDAALEQFNRIGFDNPVSVILTHVRRARALAGLGRLEQAETEFTQSFQLLETAGADSGTSRLDLLAAYAEFLLQKADPGGQVALEQAITAHSELLGASHPDTLRLLALQIPEEDHAN